MTALVLASLALPLTVPELAHLDTMTSDLRFLLAEADVPDQVQWRISQCGYKNISTFSVWGDDKPAVRAAISADILNPIEDGLTPAQQSAARAQGNYILSAWIVASQRSAEQTRLSTEAKLLRLPTILTRTTLVALRVRYEGEYGRVPDTIFPCAALIERRMEEIEEGDITAPQLTEIIAVDLCADETTTIQEVGTSVKIRKAPKAIPAPATTEEYRNRVRTMAISYVLARYKHSSRLWLRTATLEVWNSFVNYILSDEVGCYSLDTEGISVKASWATTLSYEYQIRKLACRKMQYDQLDFAAALAAAMVDLTCKERYFITPTAYIAAASRASKGNISSSSPHVIPTISKDSKGRGKNGGLSRAQRAQSSSSGKGSQGKQKGKGKGKGKGKTPDGRILCKAYNTAAGCTFQNCKYIHCCSICFSTDVNHIAISCTAAGA